MKLQNVSNFNFTALIMPLPQVYNAPVPAIVRTVSSLKSQAVYNADRFIKSANFPSQTAPIDFRRLEAVVTDPKIKVVGLDKNAKQYYGLAKLKGPGQKHIPKYGVNK